MTLITSSTIRKRFLWFTFFTAFIISSTQLIGFDKENTPTQSYQKLLKKIDVMAQDPLIFLDNLEKTIAMHEISDKKRELLINQLESLKNKFCNRSMKSTLSLPILATILLGAKTLFDYQSAKFSRNNLMFLSLHEKNVNSFMISFCSFLIATAATIIVEIEHDESVSSLFIKERKIKKKIDEIILSLRETYTA